MDSGLFSSQALDCYVKPTLPGKDVSCLCGNGLIIQQRDCQVFPSSRINFAVDLMKAESQACAPLCALKTPEVTDMLEGDNKGIAAVSFP